MASKANKQSSQDKTSNGKVEALVKSSYESIQKNDLQRAEKYLLEAVKLDETNIQAWSNLGVIAKKSKNYQRAIEHYNKGLSIDPNNTTLLCNIGSLLIQFKQFKQALFFLKKALSIDGKAATAWNNLGSCYFHFGEYEQAQAHYEQSLKFENNNPVTSFNLSWCLLRIGEFQRGFALYEARFLKNEDRAIVKNIHSPRWQRQPLTDKPKAKLCLTAEQGFGDTLQFIRFIPRLLQMQLVAAEQLVIHIQPECVELIAQSYPHLTVIDNKKPEPKESLFHLPLMSLPFVCQLDPLNIPNMRYLKASKAHQQKWQKKLKLDNKITSIGIVWKGSPTNLSASHRSIEFDLFFSIFAKCPFPVQLVNLSVQEETHEMIEAALSEKSPDYGNVSFKDVKHSISSFADTAAIIEHLDLVITIDTAVAHLSGAVGKPTFILIPYAHDWRWFRHIRYSPWYPSAKLFRQQKWHDWSSALPELKKALDEWLERV